MNMLVPVAFIAIIGALATALFFMLKGGSAAPDKSKRMANALALRVGVSVLLFVCILIAWKLDYIHPTGIPPGK